jgi:hypothetical protein
MPAKTMTAAQARAAAEQAARVAAEIEAAEQAKVDAEAERHAAAVDAWWLERRQGFPARVQGRRDAAWAEFADAVINGGDAAAAFARYRVVDAEVGEDRESIDRHFSDAAQAAADAEIRDYHALLREAGWVATVVDGDTTIREEDGAEALARADAFWARRDEWNARRAPEPGLSAAHGINPPAHRVFSASAGSYTPPAENLSFAVAVDRVVNAHVAASMSRPLQERADLLANL